MNKVKARWISLLLISIFGITACTTQPLPVVDYLRWVESPGNGLRQIKTLGNIDFSIQYKPLPYIYAQENEGKQLSVAGLTEKLDQHKEMEFYTIRIARNNGNSDVLLEHIADAAEYNIRSNYYSFDFQQDVYRVQDADTLPCAVFTHVPNYGVAPYIDFAVGFDLRSAAIKNNKEDIHLLIYDRIFNKGTVNFSIKQSAIHTTPQLQIP
jgi:3D (Asp-Asp-Asp) domain-containing protein